MKYITNKGIRLAAKITGWVVLALVILECFCYAVACLGVEWFVLAMLSSNKRIGKFMENHEGLILVLTVLIALGWQIYLCHFKETEDCPDGGCY